MRKGRWEEVRRRPAKSNKADAMNKDQSYGRRTTRQNIDSIRSEPTMASVLCEIIRLQVATYTARDERSVRPESRTLRDSIASASTSRLSKRRSSLHIIARQANTIDTPTTTKVGFR